MRRPAKTREQKQHERVQRAARRLHRAAVRYVIAMDPASGVIDNRPLAYADLDAACDNYFAVIGVRAANRLAK